ncbi:MAG: electron transfer flavoprotein-ubiquinone oxidoreductase [Gammaproteobacteria bacterium]
MPEREQMMFDVVIVGAGPAGLSAAIRYAQCCKAHHKEVRVCLIDKGSEVGAHILSGAVLEPRALDELLPDWREQKAFPVTPVTTDRFFLLTSDQYYKLPTPPQMRNHGNYMISLGELCRFLAKEAEQLGVEIFPGFAATEVLFDDKGMVKGVTLNDVGLDKAGQPKSNFQPGMQLIAKQTLFAEGARGSLSQFLIKHFALNRLVSPQTYGLGIKELWRVNSRLHRAGTVWHTIGWPLDLKTYGGSFVYHLEDNQVAIGFVVGLDYQNPYLSPYDEFQRFKHHPLIRPLLEEGEVLSYGARTLNEGGLQSVPKLTFPGGALIGCSAGFLNVPKIKGNHTAMKSGMLAAESIFHILQHQTDINEATEYERNVRKSWIWRELYTARNIRPAFQWGLYAGLAYSALDTYLFRGFAPWTFHHRYDHQSLKLVQNSKKIVYPKADGKISFDKLTNLSRSNTFHEENQPCHLKLKDKAIPILINEAKFAAPETRYCPANVYEIISIEGKGKRLQINAQNCIHCKACDIKDPTQNIEWTPPEGGGGPHYASM